MKKMQKNRITRKTPVREILRLAEINCRDCSHCCTYGAGYVLKQEVSKIAKKMNISKEEFIQKYLDEHTRFNTTHYSFKLIREKGKPYGRCIFLGKNKCKIHNIKPLHCRVGTCKTHGEDISIWFTLNHFVNENDPESVRQWAQFLKFQETIPGGELKDLVRNSDKLRKILSYERLK